MQQSLIFLLTDEFFIPILLCHHLYISIVSVDFFNKLSFNANSLNLKIFPSYYMSNLNFKICVPFVMLPPLCMHLLRHEFITIS